MLTDPIVSNLGTQSILIIHYQTYSSTLPIYRWGSWGPEESSDLSKVVQEICKILVCSCIPKKDERVMQTFRGKEEEMSCRKKQKRKALKGPLWSVFLSLLCQFPIETQRQCNSIHTSKVEVRESWVHMLTLPVTLCMTLDRLLNLSFFLLFIYLTMPCVMRDLSSLARNWTTPTAVETWNVNHWSAGEVPINLSYTPFPPK